MATPRMDITSFVGKLLEENDVDLLREGVRVLAHGPQPAPPRRAGQPVDHQVDEQDHDRGHPQVEPPVLDLTQTEPALERLGNRRDAVPGRGQQVVRPE